MSKLALHVHVCMLILFLLGTGDEKALEFVALATRDDLNANAEFIRLADTFVEVPSGSNKVQHATIRYYLCAVECS